MRGITSYLFFLIVIFFVGLFILRLKTNKDIIKKKPFVLSIIALSLFGLNWILFLSGFYGYIDDAVSALVFTPIWFFISVVGIFAAFKEHKNNLFIAYLAGGLSIFNILVGGLFLLIGNM